MISGTRIITNASHVMYLSVITLDLSANSVINKHIYLPGGLFCPYKLGESICQFKEVPGLA